MNLPTSEQELSCILHRLANEGKFSFKVDGEMDLMPIQTVHQAIEEIARAIQAARVNGTTPSACERLMGSLFVSAVEHNARTRAITQIVTISEARTPVDVL